MHPNFKRSNDEYARMNMRVDSLSWSCKSRSEKVGECTGEGRRVLTAELKFENHVFVP